MPTAECSEKRDERDDLAAKSAGTILFAIPILYTFYSLYNIFIASGGSAGHRAAFLWVWGIADTLALLAFAFGIKSVWSSSDLWSTKLILGILFLLMPLAFALPVEGPPF